MLYLKHIQIDLFEIIYWHKCLLDYLEELSEVPYDMFFSLFPQALQIYYGNSL